MILVYSNDLSPAIIANSPTIIIDRDEVDRRTGMIGGPEVLKLRVNDEQGLGAFFWVSVKFNKQGRPVATISTSPSEGKYVRKDVTGTCTKL